MNDLDTNPSPPSAASPPARSSMAKPRRRLRRRSPVYFVVAYVVMPLLWIRYAHRHPAFDDTPGDHRDGRRPSGRSAQRRPDRHRGGRAADHARGRVVSGRSARPAERSQDRGRHGAASDPTTTLRSAACISGAARKTWPSSSRSATIRGSGITCGSGNRPRSMTQGRPLWIGSATYDERVGLSHTTGQITHHIAADVDAERDHLFDDLKKTGDLADVQIHRRLSQGPRAAKTAAAIPGTPTAGWSSARSVRDSASLLVTAADRPARFRGPGRQTRTRARAAEARGGRTVRGLPGPERTRGWRGLAWPRSQCVVAEERPKFTRSSSQAFRDLFAIS